MAETNSISEVVTSQYGLHWLAYTFPLETLLVDALPIARHYIEAAEVQHWGYNGYNRLVATPFGDLLWHAEQPRMKLHVAISGDKLDRWLSEGFPHEPYLTHAHEKGGKATRIDFAADTFDRSDPTDLLKAFNKGKMKVPTGKEKHDDSTNQDGGFTLYLGKVKDAHRFVKCYRKFPELVNQGFDPAAFIDKFWTRVELTAKESYAPNLAKAMREHGIIKAGKQSLRDFFEVPHVKWLKKLISGDEGAYIEPVGEKDTNTYKWLMELVSPALDNYLFNAEPDAGLKVIHEFLRVIHKHQRNLQQEKSLGDKLQWYKDNPTD